ncbi:purine-nucleoside phosphorylase [Pelagibius litoralis]|uniref:Purine nucleoside phosphorylase n=1 Tax=Pelagibius litoralis TaxID=374515 RepID=A0A967F0F3_9PROT|nr:purine-nucleoside phosphorylase [Pelagibius litoralis]NIA70714.1 purine-nucleoside phosphorylase [Pelagibius litoralis]
MFEEAAATAAMIRDRVATPPRVALVLGSGLGAVAEAVVDPQIIPYGDLPGFPRPSVAGHGGSLSLGKIAGLPVAVLQGRAHFYESGRADGMNLALATLKALGCEHLILTNAAGSLREDVGPGRLMLIRDHINFAGVSPLFGVGGNERFVDLVDAYDPDARARIKAVAERLSIPLAEGVYVWFCGPHFETPAEIKAVQILGGDAVGMSTVPEVIVARMLGLRVAALSMITNLAAGLSDQAISHEQTMRSATGAAADMTRLLTAYLEEFGDGA